MSKESSAGDSCACGMRIAFMDQHVPHCEPARARMTALAIRNKSGEQAMADFIAERTMRKLAKADKGKPRLKR